MNVPDNVPAGPVSSDYLIDPDTECWVEWNRVCPGMIVLPFYFGAAPYGEPQGQWFYLCRSVPRKGGSLLNGQYANGQGMVQPYDGNYQFLVKRSSLPFTHPLHQPPAAA